MDALAFDVLGPLRVSDGTGELALSGSRRRVLLVRLLVSANKVVPVERLLEDVWDGTPPPSAASTLQSHVSALRGVLGKDRLEHREGGYILAVAGAELDAGLFEAEIAEAQLARGTSPRAAAVLFGRALGRWRGDALEDVAGMSWAAGETARLEELRAGALEAWLTVRLPVGDHASVVSDAESAVSDHPLREGLWAALMLALCRSGRQSDALRAYRRLSTVLGDELGIEPSTRLRDLEEAILLQKLDLDWPDSLRRSEPDASAHEARAVSADLLERQSSFPGRAGELVSGARSAGARGITTLPHPMTSLVDRIADVAELTEVLQSGQRIVTLVGPGGVGKTRLAIETGHRVAAGFPDGVVFVDVAPVETGEQLLDRVAHAVGVAFGTTAELSEVVASWLGDRIVLLVLDNCEHLLEAVALAARYLTGRCPRTVVLATSRQTLAIEGEIIWRVKPLAVPAPKMEDPLAAADARCPRDGAKPRRPARHRRLGVQPRPARLGAWLTGGGW